MPMSSRNSPGRIGCRMTNRKPSHTRRTVEPSGSCSTCPRARMKSGRTAAGTVAPAATKNAAVSPAPSATPANSSGARMEPAFIVAVSDVIASITCRRGTTAGVSAAAAGCEITCVAPVMPIATYTCHTLSRPPALRNPSASSTASVTACATATSRLRFM